jgi:RNA polymerase sigma factor (sigma-70 family)
MTKNVYDACNFEGGTQLWQLKNWRSKLRHEPDCWPEWRSWPARSRQRWAPVFEPQEDWEEIMDLPAFALAGLEGTEADASQANPEILGDRNLAQQATAAALQSLSDRHRKALVLRHLEGYALPEIAYVLNSSEEQADNWLNEAEVRLQERLRSWRPS